MTFYLYISFSESFTRLILSLFTFVYFLLYLSMFSLSFKWTPYINNLFQFLTLSVSFFSLCVCPFFCITFHHLFPLIFSNKIYSIYELYCISVPFSIVIYNSLGTYIYFLLIFGVRKCLSNKDN